VLARGILSRCGSETILFDAWCSLLVFALLGCVIGWFAERTVEESVSGRIAAELAAQKKAK
jgi:hypothetical protein